MNDNYLLNEIQWTRFIKLWTRTSLLWLHVNQGVSCNCCSNKWFFFLLPCMTAHARNPKVKCLKVCNVCNDIVFFQGCSRWSAGWRRAALRWRWWRWGRECWTRGSKSGAWILNRKKQQQQRRRVCNLSYTVHYSPPPLKWQHFMQKRKLHSIIHPCETALKKRIRAP